MAIAFRSKNEVVGTGTNAVVTEPSGAASNDVFLGMAICDNGATLTLPASWTSIYNGSSSTPKFKRNLAWIRRGGSAPDLTWVISSSVYREVHVLAYSGVTTSGNPYEANTDGGNTTGTNPDCPSVTTVNANAMVIAVGVSWSGSASGGWGMPSGYTARTRNTTGDDVIMAEKLVASPGAENPAAYTNGISTDDLWTATIALKADTGGAAASLIFPGINPALLACLAR